MALMDATLAAGWEFLPCWPAPGPLDVSGEVARGNCQQSLSLADSAVYTTTDRTRQGVPTSTVIGECPQKHSRLREYCGKGGQEREDVVRCCGMLSKAAASACMKDGKGEGLARSTPPIGSIGS